MTIHGLEVVRLRGRYYISHHPYADPPNLGRALVDKINGERGLDSIKTDYERIEANFARRFWSVPRATIAQSVQQIKQAIGADDMMSLAYFPTVFPPHLDLMTEWTYTIDLDKGVFTVNNRLHFPLSRIPSDWEEFDHEEAPLFALQARAGGKHIGVTMMLGLKHDEKGLAFFRKSQPRKITMEDSIESKRKRSIIQFNLRLYCLWMSQHVYRLDYMTEQMDHGDPVFRELCYAKLCLAAGTGELLDLRTTIDAGELTAGLIAIARGVARFGDFFWIGNVLVNFSNRLDVDEIAHAKIGRMIAYGQSRQKRFTGLVMSTDHAIIVRYDGQNVDYTAPHRLSYIYEDEDSNRATNEREVTNTFFMIASCFYETRSSCIAALPPELRMNIMDELDATLFGSRGVEFCGKVSEESCKLRLENDAAFPFTARRTARSKSGFAWIPVIGLPGSRTYLGDCLFWFKGFKPPGERKVRVDGTRFYSVGCRVDGSFEYLNDAIQRAFC